MGTYAQLAQIDREALGDKARFARPPILLHCRQCGANWRQREHDRKPKRCLHCHSRSWDAEPEEPQYRIVVRMAKVEPAPPEKCRFCEWEVPDKDKRQGRARDALRSHCKSMHKAEFSQIQRYVGDEPFIATRQLGIESSALDSEGR